MQAQLRQLLKANAVGCLHMFRAWDENGEHMERVVSSSTLPHSAHLAGSCTGDQMVSQREFRRAVERLGFPRDYLNEADELYSSFDRDGSGEVDFCSCLCQGAATTLTAHPHTPLRTG